MTPKILAFAGSAREGSFNKKLIRVAAVAAQRAGAQVTLIDLKDYPMPLMNEDLEAKEGMPEFAKKVKELMKGHDGILISTPEYNSSMPPLLKNTIDWVSRKESKEETPLIAYKEKVGAVLSASPGALGGLRSLNTLRAILSHVGVLVIPQQHALAKAHEAFNADGSIKDPKQQEAVEKIVVELVSVIKRLKVS